MTRSMQGRTFLVTGSSRGIGAEIARLYSGPLASVLRLHTTTLSEATEENKSIEHAIPVIERLVKKRKSSGSVYLLMTLSVTNVSRR